jgi:tetratricopeptide (TPR) repeat protein
MPHTPAASLKRAPSAAARPTLATARDFRTPLLLVLLTFLAFFPAYKCAFIWDDTTLVTRQAGVIDPDPLHGLVIIWTGAAKIDYFPLTETTFWLEHHLWGNAPLGYHIDNILNQAANVVLFWMLLKRLKVPGATIAAALFAIHPLLVESVVWVAERKNTLSLLFFLLALWHWLNYRDGKGMRWLWIAAGMYGLSLLAKTSVVMMPFDLLLLEWWRSGKITCRTLLDVLPFFALSVILGLVTMHFQYGQGLDPSTVNRSLLERLAQAGVNLTFYVEKIFVPYPLQTIYGEWKLQHVNALTVLPAIGWTIAILSLFAAALRFPRPGLRGTAMGVGFFVLNLLPVLGVLNMSWTSVSVVGDHLAYLSLLGAFALLGAACIHGLPRPRIARWSYVAVGALVAEGLLALTWWQIGPYWDGGTLWAFNVQRSPNSAKAHANLGLVYKTDGRWADAAEQWRLAIKLNPEQFGALSELGCYLAEQGSYAEAMPHLRAAIALHPSDLPSVSHLATSLFRTGNTAAANAVFADMMQRYPNVYEIWLAYGGMSEDSNQIPQAIDAYQHAAALNPISATAPYNLGNIFVTTNQLPQAAAAYQEAIRREPTKATAWFNLGIVLNSMGQNAPAAQAFQRAIQLDPSLAQRPKP